MASPNQTWLLEQLDDAKRRVGEIKPAELEKLLIALARQTFTDALSAARFHDALCFLRAFPPNHAVLQRVESLLATFSKRTASLQARGADLSILDDEEWAGIAGTTLSAAWTYDEVKWLVDRFPRSVSLDWDEDENSERMAATLPRFIPLLEEDAFVEPDVPYRQWLQIASRGRDLLWLVRQFERLPLAAEEKAEIFGSLELQTKWQLGDSHATRTLAKRPLQKIFYHHGPLIQRRDVSLARELASPPLKLKKLSRREGRKIIDLCREATTVRYRELYGTTRGDPTQVLQASVGRGMEIFLWGLPPESRMPLRAYQAGFALKNGVPINYFEAISLFEWMEIGFNTYYAYRDGETAWVYAQTLRLLHQVLGVTCISVYPYQLGNDSEEALKSGAFWFYRKLGFRPVRPELAKLTAAEEKKIAANPAYRTPLSTLRRLAEGHVMYELPGSQIGAWDTFRMRNLGFAVQRRMAEQFDGNSSKIRRNAATQLARSLNVPLERWSPLEQHAFGNFALVLGLAKGISRWPASEKDLLIRIIRSKIGTSDAQYVRRLQGHSRLRAELLRLGSKVPQKRFPG